MRFLLFALLIMTQCAWDWGWQQALNPNYINYPGVAYTTNQTLSNAQSGNIIVFNGTANGTQFTLPAATVGLDFTIISDVAKWMYITPQSTDIINITSTVTGKRVSNSGSAAIGDSIEVVCMTSGQWSIKSKIGTWASAT
jgi:hypothetical protein